MQVVDDDIWVMSTGRGVTDVKIYTPAAVLERFGVTPAQIPDYIGLKGDSSDNIPGVPGRRREDGGAAAAAVRLHRRAVRAPGRGQVREAARAAARSTSRTRASRCSSRPWSWTCRSSTTSVELVTTLRLPAPGRTSSTPSSSASSSTTCAGACKEITGEAAVPAAAPGPAAVAGGLVRLAAEPDVGPVAALLEKGEAALAFEPRGDGDGLAVAAHAGGDACLVAPADAGRAASLWLLAGHVVAHDAKSQPGFVSAPVGPAFDTAVAAYLLAPERPEKERTLFALAGADDGAQLVEGPAAEAAAATRATLTWRVAEAQRPRLVELGLERLFREIELPLVRVLAQMEAAGVKMDPYRLGEITARVRDRIDELADEITRLAGGPFTIGSPQQLAEVLFARLGLEPGRKGKTGLLDRRQRAARACATSTPSSRRSRSGGSSPSCSTPTSSRSRPASTRSPAGSTPPSTSWWRPPAGSPAPIPTCRTSRCAPSWASEIRACFVAEEGRKLLVADYSQIELRLMASLSGEPALLDAYHRGEDVHRVTAAAVAGIPVEEVTKRQRERAKATNFGIMYGLSAFGLSEQVDMPVEEAARLHRRVLRQVPAREGVPRARRSRRPPRTAT